MLTQRIAVVTGATGALGRVTVQVLADTGATIIATGRDHAELAALQQDLGVPEQRWMAGPIDLTDAEATTLLVNQAAERFGRIDILAILAGGWRGGSTVADTGVATLDWVLRTNLITAFNACHAVLPWMTGQGWGRIVAVGSRSAVAGQARSGAYAASKAALLALIQSIALETKNQGVTANAVLASTIDTPANRASMPDADHSRWVKPAEVAAAIAFLCSEEAAAINGAVIPIYGRA